MSKPTGQPRTDALFHKLSKAHYGETPAQRVGRVEYALLTLCAELEGAYNRLKKLGATDTAQLEKDFPLPAIWYHGSSNYSQNRVMKIPVTRKMEALHVNKIQDIPHLEAYESIGRPLYHWETVDDLLAERDWQRAHIALLEGIVEKYTGANVVRMTRAEVKTLIGIR